MLQPHEFREPVPRDADAGDIRQWARWYMAHLLKGGRHLETGGLVFCDVSLSRFKP